MTQISNKIYCEDFLIHADVPTKLLPNPYHDYPFLVIKNFLSPENCEQICTAIQDNNNAVDAKIRQKSEIQLDAKLNPKIRKTKIYNLESLYENAYNTAFLEHKLSIEEFFSVVLTTSTQIQMLEYTQGSFYKAHSDDSNVLMKEDEIIGFLPVAPQRKVTSVLFLTQHDETLQSPNSFSGGELVFNYLFDEKKEQVKLLPEAGDMVLFLSNPFFTHEVLPVKDGYRLTLVQWHDAIV